MKRIKLHIASGLLLTVALFSATRANAYTVPDLVISCGEYYTHTEKDTLGGSITVTKDGSCWMLTAVPTDGWKFLYWEDDHANTNPVRELSATFDFSGSGLTQSFKARFQRVLYNCTSGKEFNVAISNPESPANYGTIDTVTVDGVFCMRANPNSGYTFVQWADGSYANPRPLEIGTSVDTTFYATFMRTTPAQAVIDSWSATGFTLIADESEPITEAGALGTGGAITVFYGADAEFCSLPTARKTDVGIYTVSIPYSAEHAGKKCHIVYKNSAREPLATLDTYVPVLVSGSANVVVPNSNTGVHVLDGGVATFATGQTMAELEVFAGGQAIIASEDTVASVVLHADFPNEKDPGTLLVLDGGILKNNNNDTVYLDNKLYYDRWYPFALPYTVNTEKAKYRSGHVAADHFVVQWYDSKARSKNLAAWKPYYDPEDPGYDDHRDIEGCKGYSIIAEQERWGGNLQPATYGGVIRFPMEVNLVDGGEPTRSVAVQKYSSTDMALRNWNLIGLPYLSDYTGYIYMANDTVLKDKNGDPRTLQYITEQLDGFADYSPEFVGDGDYTIKPFHSFFVQFNTDVENEITKLIFGTPASSGPASAPRKLAAATTSVTNKLKAGITLSQNGKSDHTGLFIGEQYTDSYDFNADLTKMIGKGNRVKLYSLSGSQKLAYIAIPPAEGTGTLETVIPLGYDSAVVGQDMTFAMDAKRYPRLLEDENIYQLNLIDDVEGVTTNLLEDSYTCTATQRTDNSRFSLGIVYRSPKQQEVATGCEEIRATALSDGIYDLMGRLINSDVARNAGVYIIIENGKARKEVVR